MNNPVRLDDRGLHASHFGHLFPADPLPANRLVDLSRIKKAAHQGERLLPSGHCRSLSGWLLAIFSGRRQSGGVGLHLLLFTLHVLDVNRLNGLTALFYKDNYFSPDN